jgi:hypothetical protein
MPLAAVVPVLLPVVWDMERSFLAGGFGFATPPSRHWFRHRRRLDARVSGGDG